ncbi:MAG: 50S ribosomal protein L15 [Bacteroidetes bacterium]|nr:50S ribosomal protein L15 [Bacteroidota bacterium]MCL5738825.1 50S ribosomal protein L15 [Bacteroidota bacterium]
MNILGNLKYAPGARKKVKRIGRGVGSGHGKTATKGHKGQRSRSGDQIRPWFEGGQMPLNRRIPKFGFKSPFRVEYQIVNVSTLGKLAESGKLADGVVTPEVLYKIGAVSKKSLPVKILGDGTLSMKLNVSANAFSASALEKIRAAGGTVQRIPATVGTKTLES